ncbi:hypothetical protein DV451_004942 [Geotrichum candidum]|uniref:S-adenosylmethionine-dependent methyltransferase of the seven beta-strand family n=1 Tax=Geotrichum candidum TaxID=1173061 RepID=A0A9P5G1B6_GEOCN|nr:hypothetical protein DV451_004942 [Geotrichum candidum]KAF5105189.1 hypothetical protein DV453_005057 [Geotrichum candidum]
MTITHALDLPNIRRQPSADILLETLRLFEQSSSVKNFGSFATSSDPGLFRWLTSLVGSSLEWIDDDDVKDLIWHEASLRMSERCGRTAAPKMSRSIDVPGLLEAVSKLRGIDPSEQPPIVLEEPPLTSDNLGLKTWGSSLVLASRLAKHGEEILMDPVLELGAGTGLSGIVAGRLGYDVTMTDLPEITDNLRINVNKNALIGDKITVDVLDWMDPGKFLVKNKERFNCIVISDPVYQIDQPPMVANMINLFLRRDREARVCLQLPLREKFEDVRDLLLKSIKNLGLAIDRQEEQEGMDDFGTQTYVWTLWKWII